MATAPFKLYVNVNSALHPSCLLTITEHCGMLQSEWWAEAPLMHHFRFLLFSPQILYQPVFSVFVGTGPVLLWPGSGTGTVMWSLNSTLLWQCNKVTVTQSDGFGPTTTLRLIWRFIKQDRNLTNRHDNSRVIRDKKSFSGPSKTFLSVVQGHVYF